MMLLHVTQTDLRLNSALAAFITVVPLFLFDDGPFSILIDLKRIVNNPSLCTLPYISSSFETAWSYFAGATLAHLCMTVSDIATNCCKKGCYWMNTFI